MLEIQRSPLNHIEIIGLAEYLPLIKPSILPFLKKSSIERKWIAIEARLNHELVGLTISEVYHHFTHRATLYSMIVTPHHRQKGIGQQLFNFTQNFLIQEEKVNSLEFDYISEDPSTPALEKILTHAGWLPAKVYSMRFFFDVPSFNPPWLHSPSNFPKNMQLFPWKDLHPSERSEIESLVYQRRLFNPFEDEHLIDLQTSVGLRHHKKVIGWNITRRSNPETLYYANLYIDSEFICRGFGIQLLKASIQRQKTLQIPHALFEINLQELDPSWGRFIKKRLHPLAAKIERIKHPFYLQPV